MSSFRNTSVIAVGAAAMCLLSGCGGGGSTSSSPATSQPSQVTTSARHATAPSESPTHSTSPVSASTAPASSAPATEFSPPGDIPDNQVFVPYSVKGSNVRVSIPEGWARSTAQGVVTFTDKLNSAAIQVQPQPSAPTVASARRTELPTLAASVPQYAPGDVTSVNRSAGHAVLITYQQDSAADPVTGKVVRDAVERYEFWKAGQEAVITLTGPVGADNVDPWRTVTDSVQWR